MSEWQTLEGLRPHGRTRGASFKKATLQLSRERVQAHLDPEPSARRDTMFTMEPTRGFVDDAPVEFPCPLCGTRLRQTMGEARQDRAIACPGGHAVKVDGSQLHSETRKAERAWNELPEEVERRVVAAGGRRLGWSAAANRPSAAASNESRCCPAGHDRFNPAAKNGLAVRRNIGPVHAIRQRGAEVGGFPVS